MVDVKVISTYVHGTSLVVSQFLVCSVGEEERQRKVEAEEGIRPSCCHKTNEQVSTSH